MKPIDYFLLIDKAKVNYLEAKNSLLKLQAVVVMGGIATQILEKDYQNKLIKLLSEKSKVEIYGSKESSEDHKMFKVFERLITENIANIFAISGLFTRYDQIILMSIDSLQHLKICEEKYEDVCPLKEICGLKEAMANDEFKELLDLFFKDFQYTIEQMDIEYFELQEFIQKIAPGSFILKEEENIIAAN